MTDKDIEILKDLSETHNITKTARPAAGPGRPLMSENQSTTPPSTTMESGLVSSPNTAFRVSS